MSNNVNTAVEFGLPTPEERYDERLVLGCVGGCDVCGSTIPSRYFKVEYRSSAVQYECPKCFTDARERVDGWGSKFKYEP